MSAARVSPVVVLYLRDARRIGYQLRMNVGGRYLDHLRLVLRVLCRRPAATDPDRPGRRPQAAGRPQAAAAVGRGVRRAAWSIRADETAAARVGRGPDQVRRRLQVIGTGAPPGARTRAGHRIIAHECLGHRPDPTGGNRRCPGA